MGQMSRPSAKPPCFFGRRRVQVSTVTGWPDIHEACCSANHS
jgi:hypothetical protein